MYIGLIFNPLHTHHRLFPQHLLCQLSEQWANHWFTGKHFHQIYLISSRTILPTALITGKRRRRPAVALFGGGGGSRSICLLFLHQGIISIRLTSKFSLSPRQRENKSGFGSPKTIPDENRFPKVGTGEFLFPPPSVLVQIASWSNGYPLIFSLSVVPGLVFVVWDGSGIIWIVGEGGMTKLSEIREGNPTSV